MLDILTAPPRHKMTTPARVLTFDIERRPGVFFSWGPRADYLGRDKQLIRSSTISWAAKWYGQREIMYADIDAVDSTFMQPEQVPGYREMLTGLRDLLDQADVVVGYNSVRFDEAKVRGELARLGIPAPSPFRSVDLMRTTKRMGWDYASLAETLDAFGLGGKLAHQGFSLWVDFLRGDPKARKLMRAYNVQDVAQTERAYDAMRPYIKDHPNLNLWAGNDADGRPLEVCCNCGHDRLRVVPERDSLTALTAYALVECRKCGAHMRRSFIKARTTLRSVR